jgi:hypothetical protein
MIIYYHAWSYFYHAFFYPPFAVIVRGVHLGVDKLIGERLGVIAEYVSGPWSALWMCILHILYQLQR